jgi:hypothetical protein
MKPGERIASCWYTTPASGNTFTFSLNLTDGQVHPLALYFNDWDNLGREQRVEILDAATDAVLDTRTISSFSQGRYLVWNVRGYVKIRVTRIGGLNAILTGLFVD